MNRRQAIITAVLACMYQLVPMRSGIAYAVRDGFWSDRNTWKDGLFPSVTDIVFANGFNVIVDKDITAKELRNDSQHGATDGGQFVVTKSRNLWVDSIRYGTSRHPTIMITRGGINVTIGPKTPPNPCSRHAVIVGTSSNQLRTI